MESLTDNPTIGLLLYKDNDKMIVEYAKLMEFIFGGKGIYEWYSYCKNMSSKHHQFIVTNIFYVMLSKIEYIFGMYLNNIIFVYKKRVKKSI